MLNMGHLGRTGETGNTGRMLASKAEGSGVVRVLRRKDNSKKTVAVVHRDVVRRLYRVILSQQHA